LQLNDVVIVPIKDNLNVVIGIVAFTENKINEKLEQKILKKFQEQLDKTFFPKKIISISKFPYNQSLKLDKKKLEEMAKRHLKIWMYKKSKPNIFQKIHRQLQIAYDYSRGLDFLKVISVEDLKLNNKVVHKGSPSGNKYLKIVLQGIQINKDKSILDIGCAKGSVLKVMWIFH